jgi:hypothetical protein
MSIVHMVDVNEMTDLAKVRAFLAGLGYAFIPVQQDDPPYDETGKIEVSRQINTSNGWMFVGLYDSMSFAIATVLQWHNSPVEQAVVDQWRMQIDKEKAER